MPCHQHTIKAAEDLGTFINYVVSLFEKDYVVYEIETNFLGSLETMIDYLVMKWGKK